MKFAGHWMSVPRGEKGNSNPSHEDHQHVDVAPRRCQLCRGYYHWIHAGGPTSICILFVTQVGTYSKYGTARVNSEFDYSGRAVFDVEFVLYHWQYRGTFSRIASFKCLSNALSSPMFVQQLTTLRVRLASVDQS